MKNLLNSFSRLSYRLVCGIFFAFCFMGATAEADDGVVKSDASIEIPSVPGLSLFVNGVHDKPVDAGPNDNGNLETQRLYIDDLYVKYELGRFSVRGGRMSPGFGIASDRVPDLTGNDMASGYELSDRIALSATAIVESDAYGNHSMTGGTFFLDTSPLQQSDQWYRPSTDDTKDDGIGDMNDAPSFNLVLEGDGIPIAPYVSYHLAYVQQANGFDLSETETGFAAAITTKVKIGKDASITPLIEAVRLIDLGGTKDKDRQYLTGSMLTEWRNWNLALGYTKRVTEESGAAPIEDYESETSVGYGFDFGLKAGLGWRRTKDDGVSTDAVGLQFTYSVEF